MNWHEFTALLGLATAMSFTPGPNTTLATALAANHGLRRTLPFICSVPFGWGVLLSLCVLGLGAVLLAMPMLIWAIKGAGTLYMLWLATKLIGVKLIEVNLIGVRSRLNECNRGFGEINRDLTPIVLPIDRTPGHSQGLIGFWQGAALQFVNIKAWMLALAIVGGWVAGRSDAGLRFAVVLPVMLLFAFASNLTYALVGSLLQGWLAGPNGSGRRRVGFNRLMAAVLVATAVWMLIA